MESGVKQPNHTSAKATGNNTVISKEMSFLQPEIMDKSKIASPTNFNNYSNMTPTPAL